MLIFQKKLRILSLGEVFTIILRKKSCIMLKLFTGPSAPFNKKLKICTGPTGNFSLELHGKIPGQSKIWSTGIRGHC